MRLNRKPHVLLTAFEPFDGTGLNASMEGCREFLERDGSRFDLQFALLPVKYGADTEIVDRLLRERPADLVLHTGQASGTAWLRVERSAVNRRYPDARERSAGRIPIDPEGPARLESSLRVEELARSLEEAGLPAKVSEDAGVYLCNHVLYRSLQRAALNGGLPQVGFLHVPLLPQQAADDQPYMEATDIGRAISVVLAGLAHEHF